MARGQTFTKPANVTLDATGYGFCFVTAPVPWKVTRISVSTNAPVPTPGTGVVVVPPTISLYEGVSPNSSKFVEGSYNGNRTSSDTVHDLDAGESLCVEWRGNTSHAGLIGTMTVKGLLVK